MIKSIIISTTQGFVVQNLDEKDLADLNCIVAVYDNQADAEAGLKRAKELEETIRPLWLAALAHANKLESLMLDAVWSAAKPLANEGQPG